MAIALYISTLKLIQTKMVSLQLRKGYYTHQDLLIGIYITFFDKFFQSFALLRVEEIRSSHDVSRGRMYFSWL